MKKMKWQIGRKISAALLAAVMITTSIQPIPLFAAKVTEETAEPLAVNIDAQAEEGRIAYFSFDDETNGFAGDGAKADVMEGGTITIETTDTYQGTGGALKLDGATGLNVTKEADGTSLLTGLTQMTVSFYVKPDTDSTRWWAFYAAANDATQVYQQGETYLGIITEPTWVRAERFMNGDRAAGETDGKAMGDGWHHVVVTYGETETTVYVDGEPGETNTNEVALTAILGTDSADNTSILQIGKGNYGTGEYYKGLIDNYSIYNYAMTADEVLAMENAEPEEPAEPVKARIAHFSFDDEDTGLTGDGATASLIEGGTLAFETESAYNGGAIRLNGTTDGLKVTKEDGTSLLTGLEEMTISFYSKPDAGNAATQYWGFYAAPDDREQAWQQQETYIGIIAEPANIRTERYLNGREGDPVATASGAVDNEWHHIVVVLEKDATTVYVDGNAGTPVSTVDSALLSEILGNESILQIGKANYGATGEFYKGLIDEYSIFNFAMTEEEVLSMEPAIPMDPERARIAYFDFDDAATGLTGDGATAAVMGGAAPNIQTTTDAYLQGSIYLDGATGLDVTKNDGSSLLTGLSEMTVSFYVKPDTEGANKWWAFYAAPDDSAQISADGRVTNVSIYTDPYYTVANRFYNGAPDAAQNNTGDYEWHHIVAVFESDKTTLYVDGQPGTPVASGHTLPSILGDDSIVQIGKGNWQDENWPNGEFFKGYLDEYSIYNYAMTPAEVLAMEPVKERIAHFDFDDATDGLKGDGATATMMGSDADIRTGAEAYKGGAIYLDGTEDALNVVKDDGTSLLTDVREMTVSFYVKPDDKKADPNTNLTTDWAFYAAPDDAVQTYKNEKYIAVISGPARVRAERYNSNNIERPIPAEGAVTGNGWQHVVAVYRENETVVYVNGVEVGSADSTYSLSQLLGDNSILQIGKGNWGGGEYFKGYLDEYSIYNYAMTPEQVSNMERIAYFSFDNDTDGMQYDNQSKATKLDGTPAITTVTADAYLGNAVRLDGSSALQVTDMDGNSLLTGYNELTVSFYSKPDTNSTKYWAFFAAPNGQNIGGNSGLAWEERSYIHVEADNSTPTDDTDTTGNIVAGRINLGDEGSVEPTEHASYPNSEIGNGWHHIVAVFGVDETTIYVDGKPGTTVPSKDLISDILDKNSILWIGKASYGTGQYYKGYIDEFSIYNRALTAEEVLNLEPEQMREREQIAYFDFDDETLGTITGALQDDGETVKAVATSLTGSPTITNEDSFNGQALKLNGSSAIRVTAEDGSSLLTGLDEMTVSYYSLLEINKTGYNYVMYAAPTDKADINSTDPYVGICDYGVTAGVQTNTDVHRRSGYDDSVLYAESGQGANWRHVVVVYSRDDVRIYINGEKLKDDDTRYNSLRNILGENSILQFGKSNWPAGDWHKGYIDEIGIYNYAMTDEEVKALDGPYNEVTLNFFNTNNGVMSSTHYKNFTIDGVKQDDNWDNDDGEGRRLDVVAPFDAAGTATITLPDQASLESGFSVCEGDTTHTVVQDSAKYQWKLVGWYNLATGKHYDVTHGSRIVEVSSKDKNVFYADWEAATYDWGTREEVEQVLTSLANSDKAEDKAIYDAIAGDTVSEKQAALGMDTSDFIKINVFDYNELAGINSSNVIQSGTSSEWWTAINEKNGYFTMVDDSNTDNTWEQATLGNARDRDGKNKYTGGASARAGLVDGPDDLLIQHMFDTTGTVMGVDYVGKANNLFMYDKATKTYSYDSDIHGAAYNQTEERFYVYPTARNHNVSGGYQMTGFLPFNDFTSDISFNNGTTNYWFGMSVELDFWLPNDVPDTVVEGQKANQVKTENGEEDMIFHFAGDDDVWVFVDDELVLDLGGIHHRMDGNINFSTGEVYVENATAEEQARLTELVKDIQAGTHTLRIFYMERGGNESNCQISFNVGPRWESDPPTVNTVTVKKNWENYNPTNSEGVVVALYADGATTSEPNVLLNESNNWEYTWEGLPIYNEDGEEIRYEVFEVADGSAEDEFRVKIDAGTKFSYPYWTHADAEDFAKANEADEDVKIIIANAKDGQSLVLDSDGNPIQIGEDEYQYSIDGKLLGTDLQHYEALITNHIVRASYVEDAPKAIWKAKLSELTSHAGQYFYIYYTEGENDCYLSIEDGSLKIVTVPAGTAVPSGNMTEDELEAHALANVSVFYFTEDGDVATSSGFYRLATDNTTGEITVVSLTSTDTNYSRVHICDYKEISSHVFEYVLTNTFLAPVTITKVGNDNTPLKDVGFRLYRYRTVAVEGGNGQEETTTIKEYYYFNEGANAVEWGDWSIRRSTYKTADNGQVTFEGLSADTYYLEEVSTAAGYQILEDPIQFTVENGEVTSVIDTNDCLAYFDFDDTESGISGFGAKAEVLNGTSLADMIKTDVDVHKKGSLYLGGQDGLKVTAADGGSLLTGLDELTVSFYAKPEAGSTSWAFYAASAAKFAGSNETYLGILANLGGVKAERFMGGRTNGTTSYGAISADWHHVVVTYGKEGTTVYVDGEASAITENQAALTDILGKDSVIQIGKANWGDGEYFKGLIDDYSIYGYAMTAEQVKAMESTQTLSFTVANVPNPPEEFFSWRTKETELPIEGIKGIYNNDGELVTEPGKSVETETYTVTLKEDGLTFTGDKNGDETIEYEYTSGLKTYATVHVYEPDNRAYVLDYGLPVDLNQDGNDSLGISAATENSTNTSYNTISGKNLSIAGVDTVAQFHGFRVHEATTDNWNNYRETAKNTGISTLNWDTEKMTVVYTPQDFMETADVYDYRVDVKRTVATTISSARDGVRMAGTVTVAPAEVVYYEDDFTAIEVEFDYERVGEREDLMQSNDQDGVYGYDGAYDENLLVHYDFSQITTTEDGTTIVPDMSGNGNDATVYGNCTFEDDVLVLPGGAKSERNYVQLPTGMFDGQNELTISMWINNNGTKGDYSAFSFNGIERHNGNPKYYFILNPCNKGGFYKAVMTDPWRDANPWETEAGISDGHSNSTDTTGLMNQWAYYTITLTEGTIKAYLNGDLVGTAPIYYKNVSDFGENLTAYIGASEYGDDTFNGSFKDIRIYDKVLTEEVISDLYAGVSNAGQTPLDSAGSSTRLDSNGNVLGEYGRMKFDFTGTGFDIVGRTATDTATIYVNVHCTSDSTVADRNYFLRTYYANGELYQLPLISTKDLPYGTYTVTIEAIHSQDPNNSEKINRSVYIDGIRIYNPAGTGTDNEKTEISDLYLRTEYQTDEPEVKDLLLGSVKFENLDAMLKALEVPEEGEIPDKGTTSSAESTISLVTANEEEGLVISHSGTTVIEDIVNTEAATTPYLENVLSRGPNNEVYLAKGNAIAFLAIPVTETDDSGNLLIPEEERTLQIEAKKVDGQQSAPAVLTSLTATKNANGDYDAQEAQVIALRTYTQMYYEIDLSKCSDYDDEGTKLVVLASTGDSMVSLTNLKVKGYTFKALTETSDTAATYARVQRLFAVFNRNAADDVKEIPFTDVKAGSWYEASVRYVYEQGIMTGVNETEFAPAKEITRAEFAVVLHRMAGSPAAEYESRFPDVKDDKFYTDAIMWASHVGIITGYVSGDKAGCFGVSDLITREQMAVMLYRYAVFTGQDVGAAADIAGYSDFEKVGAYAEDAFAWAIAEGLIQGSNGMLAPREHANRAMIATIVQRFLEQ